MKLRACTMFLLLIGVCLQRVDCRLPDITPASPQLQVEVSDSDVVPPLKRDGFGGPPGRGRLPGLCRRLKRRRVTVLCNQDRFCWRGRSPGTRPVQVCLCPRGSRCPHFYIHSL